MKQKFQDRYATLRNLGFGAIDAKQIAEQESNTTKTKEIPFPVVTFCAGVVVGMCIAAVMNLFA